MKLSFQLSEAEAEALLTRAQELGVAPEDLARAALAEMLTSPSHEFQARVEPLLMRNAELYRRLARG